MRKRLDTPVDFGKANLELLISLAFLAHPIKDKFIQTSHILFLNKYIEFKNKVDPIQVLLLLINFS